MLRIMYDADAHIGALVTSTNRSASWKINPRARITSANISEG